MNIMVYGAVRYKVVDHDLPILLTSEVSLAEAVEVWIGSLKETGRLARLARELSMKQEVS